MSDRPRPGAALSLADLGFDAPEAIYCKPGGGYRCVVRHVEGAIFLMTQTGYVDESSVDEMISIFKKIRVGLQERSGLDRCVVINEIPAVNGGSLYAKRLLMRRMREWPGTLLITVGAKPLDRIIGKILTRLLPDMAIRMVGTREEALALARLHDPCRAGSSRPAETVESPLLPPNYSVRFDQLFEAIGRISWDSDFRPVDYAVPPEDPFHELFSAVTLLHRDIREMIERIETARRAAEKANAAKDRFIADVSHELRTPLHGVMLLCDLIGASSEMKDVRRYTETIRDSARRMNHMIGETLDLARIEAGRMTLSCETFALRRQLDLTLAPLAMAARRKGLRFELRVSDAVPPFIIGDPVKILEVLTNLVGNAVKYTDAGEISVAVRSRAENGRLLIAAEVSDTGIGIAPEEREHLFKRFHRLEKTDAVRRGGTGLGLSIAREFARLMGGDVEVSGEAERGSTFTFTFRCDRGEMSAAEEPSSDAAMETVPPDEEEFPISRD